MALDSVTPPAPKSLIIFVHGFNSGPDCWHDLLEAMAADPEMTAAFDWKTLSYDSKVLHGLFNLLYRLPDYIHITAKLDQCICDNFPSSYDQLFLVGHSQGGLIIQSWLGQVLNGHADRLKRVREIIFICTPTLGSTIAGGLRKAVFSIIPDPQETRLRVLNDDVAATRRAVEENVVQTTLRDANHWTVPILAIWGGEDNVVQTASAQASFDNVWTWDGDHSSVLQPKNSYAGLKSALLAPVGHRHVFEIARYETSIIVEQLANPNYIARRGARVENKTADNFARVVRQVTFSERNTCTDLFHFNYQTGPAGFLDASFDEVGRSAGDDPPPNEGPSDAIGRWMKGENDVTYDFRPTENTEKTYVYEVRVWGGFSVGNRDAHFHFDGNCRCKDYVFTVDLSAYVARGWSVTRPPELYVDPAGTAEHEIGEQRLPANLQRCTLAGAASGKWTWLLHDFRGGIVDAVWDVAPPV
jgi:pimeloyl-ACP methyl ester carboxylesterase